MPASRHCGAALFLFVFACASSSVLAGDAGDVGRGACNPSMSFKCFVELVQSTNELKDVAAMYSRIKSKEPLRGAVSISQLFIAIEEFATVVGSGTSSTILFAEKVPINPAETKKIVQWGDLHGSIHSFVRALLSFEDLMNDDWTINPKYHLVTSGDMTDRGVHGVDTYFAWLRLKTKNPNHVTVVRGNHESEKNMYNLLGSYEVPAKLNFEQPEALERMVRDSVISTKDHSLRHALLLGACSAIGKAFLGWYDAAKYDDHTLLKRATKLYAEIYGSKLKRLRGSEAERVKNAKIEANKAVEEKFNMPYESIMNKQLAMDERQKTKDELTKILDSARIPMRTLRAHMETASLLNGHKGSCDPFKETNVGNIPLKYFLTSNHLGWLGQELINLHGFKQSQVIQHGERAFGAHSAAEDEETRVGVLNAMGVGSRAFTNRPEAVITSMDVSSIRQERGDAINADISSHAVAVVLEAVSLVYEDVASRDGSVLSFFAKLDREFKLEEMFGDLRVKNEWATLEIVSHIVSSYNLLPAMAVLDMRADKSRYDMGRRAHDVFVVSHGGPELLCDPTSMITNPTRHRMNLLECPRVTANKDGRFEKFAKNVKEWLGFNFYKTLLELDVFMGDGGETKDRYKLVDLVSMADEKDPAGDELRVKELLYEMSIGIQDTHWIDDRDNTALAKDGEQNMVRSSMAWSWADVYFMQEPHLDNLWASIDHDLRYTTIAALQDMRGMMSHPKILLAWMDAFNLGGFLRGHQHNGLMYDYLHALHGAISLKAIDANPIVAAVDTNGRDYKTPREDGLLGEYTARNEVNKWLDQSIGSSQSMDHYTTVSAVASGLDLVSDACIVIDKGEEGRAAISHHYCVSCTLPRDWSLRVSSPGAKVPTEVDAEDTGSESGDYPSSFFDSSSSDDESSLYSYSFHEIPKDAKDLQ